MYHSDYEKMPQGPQTAYDRPSYGRPSYGYPGGYGGGSYGNGAPSGRKKTRWIVFGIILAAVILVIGACSVMAGGLFGSDDGILWPAGDYIGVVYVEGTITSAPETNYFGVPLGYQHQWTLDRIDDMIDDPDNKGILLVVNSPGGGVYESDELHLKIMEYQQATGKPVYAYFGAMAASGGYYISASADRILANRNCWTGSIGVTMGTLFDFTELLQKHGIKTQTITSGRNKAMGSGFSPMTPEQQAIFQGLVDDAYNQFTNIIAEGRKMDINKVRQLADGRIYTARQAVKNGLVDEITDLDGAKNAMLEENGLEDCEFFDVEHEPSGFLESFFISIDPGVFRPSGDLALLMKIVEKEQKYPIAYLYRQ